MGTDRAFARISASLCSVISSTMTNTLDNDFSYPDGTINTTTFTVILHGTDDCSRVIQGEVQVSTDGGSWIDYASTIDNIASQA